MFYSNQILARKGPLGLVWIAAHMEGRLKRQQINNTSIPASVDTLLDPEVPLALRLSGQLLLGVVRIYARKVAYLQQDCDAALVKIRVALRPADNCNLPPDSQVAPVEAITMLDPAQAAAVAERARKARAAKAAGGDGKNNAAAGNAAIVDGWLGPVDEDGMMLGLDDIAWDQEVLLGDSSQPGFGLGGYKFEPNRMSFGLTPSKSGLGSQDVSAVFGMYSSQDDMETFDIEDEEAAAVWDLDELEVERLRAAPSQSQQDSLGGLSGLMEGDTPAGGKATATAADSPAEGDLGHDGFTPGSLGHQEGTQPDMLGPDGNTMDSMDLDIDPAGALPPTPQAGAGEAAAAGGGDDEALQHDPYDLDDMGNLCDMLPPTPAAADGDEAATATAAAGDGASEGDCAGMGTEEQQQQPAAPGQAADQAAGTPTKTFQRRNTRQQAVQEQQQQQGVEGSGAEGSQPAVEGGGEQRGADPVTAAKAARRRRVSGLLGLKRRVMIDSAGDDDAGARPAGTRHAPTELPAAEIRALLADRAPLMDMERVHKVSKQLQQQAASSLSAQGAAALAQQQLRAITSAAAAGPLGATARPGAGVCFGCPGMPALPGLGPSLGASFAGGLGLPVELQQLFSNAAAAAAARGAAGAAAGPVLEGAGGGLTAAAGGGAGAVAPTAPLEEIGGLGDDAEDLQGFAPGVNPVNPAGRCSLSLSLAGTPGSAAAGAGRMQATPGTDAGTAAPAGYTPGFAAGGDDGYTPGTAGFGPGAEDDVLQPLDDVNLGDDDVNLGREGGGMFEEQGAWVGRDEGGEEKENTPGPGSVAGTGGKGSGRMVWPADAETLLEQEAAEREVPDGSFTSRTRLVVHHLRRAATAAANTAGGGSTPSLTPTVGSKRRISAAAVGTALGSAGAGSKEGEGQYGQQGSTAGPVLSFEGITQGHSRLDACRWFYEVLVLSNKGLVGLQQGESYGDISVTPDVGAMARV